MSLIGPRPERPEFVAELEQVIDGYADRHAALPGISGLAQVQLAPDTDVENVRQKLVFDLHYVRNQSFSLDARIALATVLHLLGMSFGRLRRFGVVPVPEMSEPEVAVVRQTRSRQAA
jgi:lipopolysaccharide/colanic/teichoic acid biosynthesis glycosyltransferase